MAKNQKSYTPEFKQQIVDLRNKAGVCANLIIGQLAHRKVGQYQYN